MDETDNKVQNIEDPSKKGIKIFQGVGIGFLILIVSYFIFFFIQISILRGMQTLYITIITYICMIILIFFMLKRKMKFLATGILLGALILPLLICGGCFVIVVTTLR
jgi:hypothetical protein